ncbi:hybrid sensor histidine kinase/response regulator transcription factor [Arenibacter troitsensis]|uniref:histidine kinase n=1 Tax=Arenibacter troitsensis TaxID=188872 RepID=A0A1X7I3J2_9FLAO|nr:hybrid sensor histidine kinase/response regulator transcription factor [Arenibacter troitsensis]SMG08530.1 Signal transduction histidine kinase [Arenibacter troitsensis]
MALTWKNLFLLIVLTCNTIFGQKESINLPFFSLNVKDGLSQNYITCTTQDFEGFIWIGTRNGLYKYDGYHFEQINLKEKGIQDNHINCLYRGSDQNLWIGTNKGPVLYDYQSGDLTPLFLENGALAKSITTFFQQDKKNIWIGTGEGQLLSYNIANNEIKKYSHPGFRNISSIGITNTNTLLIGFKYGGLLTFSIKNEKFSVPKGYEQIGGTGINSIIEAKPETFLVVTPKGVFLYKHGVNPLEVQKLISPTNANALNSVISLLAVNNKHIWLGTDGHGILEYTIASGKLEPLRFEGLSPSFSVTSMFKARDNSIWIGTTNQGLKIVNPYKSQFNHWAFEKGNKTGLSSNSVLGLTEDSNGNIILAMDGGGITIFDPNSRKFEHYFKNSEEKRVVNTVIQDKNNRIWAGTFNHGYHVSRLSSSYFLEPLTLAIPKEIENISVKSFLRDKQDNIWIGTITGGIYLYDNKNGTIKKFKENNPLIQYAQPYCIYQSSDSKIWFGCYSGLYVYNPKDDSLKEFFPENGSHFKQVISIEELDGDNLWLGTKTGLYNINRKYNKTTLYTEKQGLPSNVVNSLLVDSSKFLWLGTDKGLSQFNPATKEFRNFGREDGIHGLEFNENARLKGSDGTLYFGNTNGVYFFHPNQIKTNPIPPEIVLTDFKINSEDVTTTNDNVENNRPINQVEEINLNHRQNFFTLHFTALNFTNPDKNQYKYKLMGFDQDWIFANNERKANYTNIPPGEYIFKVEASNNDGIWSIAPKTLKIIIYPPWWLTWWARILFVIITLGSLILVNTYVLKQIKLKNDLKIERLEKNNQIQLNEFKTKLFTNLTHELRTPLTMILSPLDKLINKETQGPEYKSQLLSIQRNAQNLLKLINEWLDYRKSTSTQPIIKAIQLDLVNFAQDITEAFKELATDKSMEIKFISQTPSIPCHFDPRAIEKVISNLISNAIKYSEAGSNITIQLGTSSSKLDGTSNAFFKIEDEGKGISLKKQELIFERFQSLGENPSTSTGIGLALSKELVEAHHGKLEFTSIPQKGSTFTVNLPLGTAHFTEEQLSNSADQYTPTTTSQKQNHQIEITPHLNVINSFKVAPDYTVLIVEDEDEIREFIAKELADHFKVLTANNGKDGFNKAVESMPDLVLSDVLMPKATGLELCKSLKTNLKTSHIPIILLTALSDEESQVQGLKEGAEDYITKPFSINALFYKIKSIIENRQLITQRYQIETIMKPKELAQSTPDKDLLEKAVNIIHNNISEPNFTVDKLVMELGMSRTPFFKKIKSLTNLTPNEFLKIVRLRHAAQMLLKTDLNISEISFEVGFLSAKYFRSTFKKQFGETPSSYREKRITKT